MTTLPDLEPAALEACPFCDGEPQLIDGGPGNFYVRCVQCNATGDDGSRDYALSRWNRRAARSAPEAGKAVDWREAMQLAIDYLKETKHGSPARSAGHNARLVLEAALASVPAPSGAEPAAWMVLRKGNLHLPVLTSKEDAVRYQQYNPEETLQTLYASPQAVPAEDVAGLIRDLHSHADEQIEDNFAYIQRADTLMRKAAAALTASEAEAAPLRRKLEEAELERDRLRENVKDLGDRKRVTGHFRDEYKARAEAAERKLEEARKALEPFAKEADAISKAHLDGHASDLDMRPVAVGHLRAAARSLSEREWQEE